MNQAERTRVADLFEKLLATLSGLMLRLPNTREAAGTQHLISWTPSSQYSGVAGIRIHGV